MVPVLFAVLCTLSLAARPVPSFDINLDLAPELRFKAVLTTYNATIWAFYQNVFVEQPEVQKFVHNLIQKRGPENAEMQAEIQGVSTITGLSLEAAGAVQMLYELQTLMVPIENITSEYPTMPWRGPGCTGIIAMDKSGVVRHARNLDFSPKYFMQNLTYQARFLRNGTEVFRAQMVAAYSCIVTGMRMGPNGFTLETNTRYTSRVGGNQHPFYNTAMSPTRELSYISDQPRKRAKTNDDRIDNEISSLNESGVINLQYGMIDDAQHYFVKALDCFTVKHHKNTIQSDEIVQRNDFGQTVLDQGIQQDAVTILKSPSTNDSLEYDEGVRAYIDTMIIGEGISDSMQSATLYYNVAQTFVHLNKYSDAMSWFELALMCIKFVPSNTSIATAAVKIRHNLGYCCYRLAKSNEAKYCFEKALELAEEANLGFPYTAAARNAYAVAMFYNASPNNETLPLLEKSLIDYKCIFGDTSREVAAVLNNIGRVHFANGNFKDAVTNYKKSLSIRRQILSKDSIDMAATICSAGQALHRQGELTEALSLYEEFLALSVSGKYNKRDIAIIAKSEGEIYHKQGCLVKAKAVYEKALEAAFAGFGHIHPEIASIYNRLGNLFYETNNLEKALECYKEGLTIEQLTLPACHARIVVTIANIAQIHYQLGEYAMALARYNQVYHIQLKAHGPRSVEVSKALATMGEMEYKMRNFDAAFTLFQDVLVIQRDHFGEVSDGLEIASTMNSIGIVACAQGEFKIAQSCFDSSLRVRQRELGDHKDTATLWYNLATVNEELGDEESAIKMYKECLRIERGIIDSTQKCDVIDSLQRLGRLHQRRGELDEALQYFKEALDILRTRGDAATFAVAKFLNLVGNVHLQRAETCEMMKAYSEASRIYRETSCPPHEVLVIAGYYMYGLSKLHPICAAVA